ncbi:MAG: translocation/assembly module TamB domain-containing protein [Burkholderiaceae bacterium]|nr:translocation/assembly module TamB domain-containing protein [Burkholderiaceae bacterium]
MNDPLPAPAPAPAAAPATSAARKAAPRRLLRWIAGLALLGLAALLLLGAALWWAAQRPASLAWLLAQVPGLQVQGVEGAPADARWRIRSLRWSLPGGAGTLAVDQLELEHGAWQWQPRPGLWLSLDLRRLQAEQLRWTSGPPSGQPLQPPAHLQLPLALRIDELVIGRLLVDEAPAITGLRARLGLQQRQADGRAQHRIDELQLVVQQLRLQGEASLQAGGELALSARLTLQPDGAPAPGTRRDWQARISAQGPLQAIALSADLQGAASLQARAQLQPFKPWPLAMLEADTEALDLAALWPGAPRTRLQGRAQLHTRGLDRPMQLDLALRNALPGDWSQNALPLRQLRLRAEGEARHRDRLTLQQLELQLADAGGDAGRIQGRGRWQGDGAELSLDIQGLQPQRLDRRAAALSLSGPLTLKASGLTPDAQGRLAAPLLRFDARLRGAQTGGAARPADLQADLQAQGELGRQHLQLDAAEARAGEALARASGRLQHDGRSWALRGRAELVALDPLRWWPGPAGSLWQRGGHRLGGQFEADLRWTPPATATGAVAAGDSTPLARLQTLLQGLAGEARAELADSRIAGLPLSAGLQLARRGAAARLDGRLQLAGQTLALQGQADGPAAAQRWNLQLQAPSLAALQPLQRLLAEALPERAEALAAAWPGAGRIEAQAGLEQRSGGWSSQGSASTGELALGTARLQSAQLRWQLDSAPDATLALSLDARQLRDASAGGPRIDQLQASLDGSWRQHRLQLAADLPLRPPAWAEPLLGPAGSGTRLSLSGQGGWTATAQGTAVPGAWPAGLWRWQSLQLRASARNGQNGQSGQSGSPWLALDSPGAELQFGAAQLTPQRLQLAPGRIALANATALTWQQLRWQAQGAEPAARADDGLQVEARLETINLAQLLARLQPDMGWGGDLTLGGRIQLRQGAAAASQVQADIALERQGGDLQLVDELGQVHQLGLSELRLAASARDGQWQLAQGFAGRNVGAVAGAQVLSLAPGTAWPTAEAALNGVLEARVDNLGVWGAWLPPGWRLGGHLHTSASAAGTLGAPLLTGQMRGSGLSLRNLLEGVSLGDGELSVALEGERARIEQLRFSGADGGTLSLQGQAQLGRQPVAELGLSFQRFRLLGRIDRRIKLSGQAQARLDRQSLQLDGDLRIDEGLIDISRGEAPSLDADVQVRRPGGTSTAATAAGAEATRPVPAELPPALRQARVALRLDLSEQLRLRGHGVDTGLHGTLNISAPGGRPALHGDVRTQGGQYAAYGQKLDIRRGLFQFTGPLDNPRLDVQAVRPNLDVVVGVALTGTAQLPRVRLFSEPAMSEYEQLSWLVLGRSPDGLGRTDTALLQRAAFALLAGDGQSPTDNLLEAVGLTDFSVRQSDDELRETVVSLGKQLSRRWYLGYERSVNATTGTWQLIYRLAQRFTLRAQTGGENAVDLIWSWRWN